MSSKTVKVNMFGDFSVYYGGKVVEDNSNRSRKVWLLLAYLIYNRGRDISQEELTRLLWGDDDSDSDPRGALKALLYRVRSTLNRLGDSAGHTFVVNRSGAYAWNPDVEVQTDIDEFETLLRKADFAADSSEKLDLYKEALALYKGSFLSRLSTETWVIPIDVYFANAYTNAVLAALSLMEADGKNEEICQTAALAISNDPYNEDFHRFLMSALIALGRREEAAEDYERFRGQLYSIFGVEPSEEIRKLYREAVKTVNRSGMTPDSLIDQLREPDAPKGALICEYDFFKVLYHAAARAVVRSGDVVHVAMFSVRSRGISPLSRSSLERTMDKFEEQIRINLRGGDIAARCSASQFIVMLQQSNFENSNLVCDRVVRAFYRRYPHTSASIEFSVKALEPMV